MHEQLADDNAGTGKPFVLSEQHRTDTIASTSILRRLVEPTVNGPTGACAGNATCGTVTVTTGTAAGPYTGNLVATPNAGGAATTPVSLSVLTPAVLRIAKATPVSPTVTPQPAELNCSVFNDGETGITSISYSGPASNEHHWSTGPCAGGRSAAGVLNVKTAYGSRNLAGLRRRRRTPVLLSPQSFNLVVLTLLRHSRFRGMFQQLANDDANGSYIELHPGQVGQSALSSISYSTIAGVGINGPTGPCAAGATCGIMIATSGTTTGTYGRHARAYPKRWKPNLPADQSGRQRTVRHHLRQFYASHHDLLGLGILTRSAMTTPLLSLSRRVASSGTTPLAMPRSREAVPVWPAIRLELPPHAPSWSLPLEIATSSRWGRASPIWAVRDSAR